MLTTSKVCRDCGAEKPLDSFYKHNRMADGHLNKCKVCVRGRIKTHYEENKEAILERQVEYNRKPENSVKRKARKTVSNAIRDGRMSKGQTCESCGTGDKIEAHHPDYSQPLNVEWLCSMCHADVHMKEAA